MDILHDYTNRRFSRIPTTGCTCHPSMEMCQCLGMENYVYMDILEDAMRYFKHGLACGGLTDRILSNRPFGELRTACHTMVSGNTLANTTEVIHHHVETVYDGATCRLAWVEHGVRRDDEYIPLSSINP